MGGYEYRATDARRRRAEEFTRRREAAEAARKLRAQREKKPTRRTPKPAPTEETPMPDTNIRLTEALRPLANAPRDEFAVIQEDPPPINGAEPGRVAAAARETVSILNDRPNTWFRVAHRKSKASASSYASTLRKIDKTIQTRTILGDDGETGILYARVNPDLKPRKTRRSKA